MKRIVLVLLAATLGVSLPASASAQRVRDLVDQVVQAQQQQQQQQQRGSDNRGKGGEPRGNNNDNRGNGNRGNDSRGNSDNRGPDNRGNDNRGNGNNGGGNDNNRRPAPPQPGENWRGPQNSPSREISMSQAIRQVEQNAGPGHHLDGSREERGGRSVYRIQWATDRGERRDYYVDAQTGAIVGGR